MASILFLRETIARNQFICNYFKNKKPFLHSFSAFVKFSSNFEHFQKKVDSYS